LSEAIKSLVDRKINNFDEVKAFIKGDDGQLVNSFQSKVILDEDSYAD
jgi:hypothetical protein